VTVQQQAAEKVKTQVQKVKDKAQKIVDEIAANKEIAEGKLEAARPALEEAAAALDTIKPSHIATVHAAPPHHAHHGVCAAAVPEEAGGARDRSGGARVPGAQLVGVAEADGAEQLLAGPAQLSQGLDQRGDGRVDEAAARDGGLQSGDGQEGVRRRGGLVLVDRGHGNLLHH